MAKKDFNALNKQIAELRKVGPAAAGTLLLCSGLIAAASQQLAPLAAQRKEMDGSLYVQAPLAAVVRV